MTARPRVVALEQLRVDASAREFAAAFVHDRRGVLIVDASTVEDVERSRVAARRALRQLGIHVRTGLSDSRLWMASAD